MAGELVDNLKSPLLTAQHGQLDDLRPLAGRVTFDAAVLVSLMPHGRLQIVRASLPDADLVRRYNRDEHTRDQASWAALRGGEVLHDPADPLLPGRCLVLPAGEPVLAGYPAVLHVFRREQDPPFAEADMTALREELGRWDAGRAEPRAFILDRQLTPLLNAESWAALDGSLRASIEEYAREGLADLSDKEPTITSRRTHTVEAMRQQAVRYIFSRHGAAHPGQSGVIVCLQPRVDEWAGLSPERVPSHAELARFLPALQFMRTSKTATLNEVSASVGLSPFHFHRRFVDLTGMAPKQYLFDCQIADAQSMLLENKLELYAIARQCGFAHQSHFTSRFRQATGFTPTRWRRAAVANVNATAAE